MRIRKNTTITAVIITGLIWTLPAGADDTGAAPAAIARNMTDAVEDMASQARAHLAAHQRLIDAEALVARRAAIVELQGKCLKNGYSCIQADDLLHITPDKNAQDRTRQAGPVDSSTLVANLSTSARGGMTSAPAVAPADAAISWTGNTGNKVILTVNGEKVIVPLGKGVPNTRYKVKRIAPTHITLSRDDGAERIVPVAWDAGDATHGTGAGLTLPQFKMPPADSGSFSGTSLNLPPSMPSPPNAGRN